MTRCSIATRRRQPGDQVHVRLFQLLDELPRIGRHAVEKTALAFREEHIESERRFARAAQTGDDDHLVARDLERDVLEIVLARAVDGDGMIASASRSGTRVRPPRLAQIRSRSSSSVSEGPSRLVAKRCEVLRRVAEQRAAAALLDEQLAQESSGVRIRDSPRSSSGVPVATSLPAFVARLPGRDR